MTFGEKIKKLRTERGLTQDELAEKIFVTRTAISKWETDKGYPGIDSLKQLSQLFNISIDELISESDIENKRLIDEAKHRKFYWCAIACLAVATLGAIIYYFYQVPYFYGISIAGVVAYVAFGLLSKPDYKRMAQRRTLMVPLVISRIVLAVIIIAVIVSTFFNA